MVFKGTTGVYKRIYFVILIPNEQESKIICEFEMDFEQMLVILGLKTGLDNESFCLK